MSTGTYDSLKFDKEAVQTIRFCLYVQDGLNVSEAENFMNSVFQRFTKYNLKMEIVITKNWQRHAFVYYGLADQIRKIPLLSPCDRIFVLVARNFWDLLYGAALLPEVLGYVDDESMTRGYGVYQFATANQIIMPPSNAIEHEIYHLLGCEHALIMDKCYERIMLLKREAEKNQDNDFFPSWSYDNERVVTSRGESNKLLKIEILKSALSERSIK